MRTIRPVILLVFSALLIACQLLGGLSPDRERPIDITSAVTEAIKVTAAPSTTQALAPGTSTETPQTALSATQKIPPEPIPTWTPLKNELEVTQAEIDTLAAGLAQAWKDGVEAETIKNQLAEQGWTIAPSFDWMAATPGVTFAEVDLDGDGRNEWVVSVFMQPFGGCFLSGGKEFGELWVIGEGGLTYRVYQSYLSLGWATPVIIAAVDMTGDGLAEIVARSMYCDVNSYLGGYHILGFRNGKIESVVELGNELERTAGFVRAYFNPYLYAWEPGEIAIPAPSDQITDQTGDGLPDLVLTGGRYGSGAAGDWRERTEVWSWDGTNISLSDLIWEASDQRFYLLYDANAAFAAQDDALAESLYERVITDESLQNGVGFAPPEMNLAAAQQFAAFRLVLLYLRQGDEQNAEKWNTWLQTTHAGSLISQAAEVLVGLWGDPGSPGEVCEQIDLFFQENAGLVEPGLPSIVTGPLDDAGYANPKLGAEDVCPLDQ